MCIYLGDNVDSTTKSEDHIFPACIGGIKKLNNQAVSAKANSIFMRLENKFSHDSLIAMLREFHGPGKRGKAKIPEGTVRIFFNAQNKTHGLCYMLEGNAYTIPYIIINTDGKSNIFTFSTNLTDSTSQKSFEEFAQKVNEILSKSDKFTYIKIDDAPTKQELIIGLHAKKIFIATDKPRENIDLNFIRDFFSRCLSADTNQPQNKTIFSPTIHGKIAETEEANRIYAKTAFNCLCYLKGIDFVNHQNFDLFRKWIISGEGHSEDWIDEDIVETPEFKNIFPEYSHWCIFTIHERQIVSIVSFYGFSTRKFVIGELPYNSSFPLIGLICDWKNRKEMTVDEVVYNYAKDNHKKITTDIMNA